MKKEIEISIPPDFIDDSEYLKKCAAKKLHFNIAEIKAVQIIRRSVDARPEYLKKCAAKKLHFNIAEIKAVQIIRRSVDARPKNHCLYQRSFSGNFPPGGI